MALPARSLSVNLERRMADTIDALPPGASPGGGSMGGAYARPREGGGSDDCSGVDAVDAATRAAGAAGYATGRCDSVAEKVARCTVPYALA